jgi:hypothetical protein
VSRWIKEGRKNHALKLIGLVDSKASGLRKHPSSVNTRKASLERLAHRGVSGKDKFP